MQPQINNEVTIERIRDILRSINNFNDEFGCNVSKSEANGKSIYISDSITKVRFSDHGVSKTERVINESHFGFNQSDEDLELIIKQHFTKEYKKLGFQNGDNFLSFKKYVHITDFGNWKIAKVYYKEVEFLAIKEEDFYKYKIIEVLNLAKKGDKFHCKIEKTKFCAGVQNEKTGELHFSKTARLHATAEVEKTI